MLAVAESWSQDRRTASVTLHSTMESVMPTISYRLPVTTFVLTATRRHVTDDLAPSLNAPPITETLQEVVLRREVTADAISLDVEIEGGGLLATHKGVVSLSADRRLMSVDWASTGALPRIVSAVASLAGQVLGAVALVKSPDALAPALGADTEAEAVLFKGEHEDVVARASALAARRTRLVAALDQLFDDVAAGSAMNARARQSELEAALRRTEADQVVVRTSYSAWRNAQRHVIEEPVTLRIAVHDLPGEDPLATPAAAWSPSAELTPIRDVQDLADRYGLGLRKSWPQGSSRGSQDRSPSHGEHEVVVRTPDLMELVVTRRLDPPSGPVVEVSRTRHLVVDDRSRSQAYALSRSRWADRSVVLEFDEDGLVSRLTTGGSSAVVAAVEAAAGVSAQLSAGIDAAVGVSTSLAAARRTALANETALLEAQLNRRTQAAAVAGLSLTERDALQLAVLQERKDLLEARASVIALDPTATLSDLEPMAALPPARADASLSEQVVRIVITGGAPETKVPVTNPALGGSKK
jgi:hypothetical protein